MKLTKGQKKFIRTNYSKFTLEELAIKTKLPQESVKAYLKKLGKDTKITAYKNDMKASNLAIELKTADDFLQFFRANIDFITILVVFCLIVYAVALNGEFISDDIPGFVNNPSIKQYPQSIGQFNLQNIIYSLFYNLFGTEQLPLHLFSLCLHILNTVLVIVLVSNIFGKRVAMITSLIFALHPVNTEAVSWISAINYLTNATTFLIVAISYVWYKNTKAYKWPVTPTILFFGMLLISQNPWSLVIPFLILLIDQLFLEKKINIKSAIKISPMFLSIPLLLVFLQSVLQSKIELTGGLAGRQEPLYKTIPYTIFKTLELLIFPKNLTIYHEGEPITTVKYNLMIIATIITFSLIVYLWKKNERTYAGLIAMIFIAISPVFSPIQVAWFIADRYLYISTIAFGILVALFLLKLEKKTKNNALTLVLLTLLVVTYSARSIKRNTDWKTRKSLWEATAQTSPNSARVHNNLGDVYALEGNYERAVSEFQIALLINPTYFEAMHNLGFTYMRAGDLDNAETYLKKSYEINPQLFQSTYKLGLIETQRGNREKAIEYFEKTVEINPNFIEAQTALKALHEN
ncbi:MAG: tetratricopeptide repeat protein [Patescibacteria group bacterium]